jgi:hypothetical protein
MKRDYVHITSHDKLSRYRGSICTVHSISYGNYVYHGGTLYTSTKIVILAIMADLCTYKFTWASERQENKTEKEENINAPNKCLDLRVY